MYKIEKKNWDQYNLLLKKLDENDSLVKFFRDEGYQENYCFSEKRDGERIERFLTTLSFYPRENSHYWLFRDGLMHILSNNGLEEQIFRGKIEAGLQTKKQFERITDLLSAQEQRFLQMFSSLRWSLFRK